MLAIKKPILTIMMIIGGAGLAHAAPAAAPAEARAGLAVAQQVFAAAKPKDAYDRLSAAERKRFDDVVRPASHKVSTSAEPLKAAAAAGPCWRLHRTGEYKGRAGNTLYTFWQTSSICVRNKKVYKVKVESAGGETSTPGWRIAQKPSLSTKNVSWEGRGLARYHFVLGAGGWDIQHPSDCLQVRLNADKRHSSSSLSCNIGS
jgi:hypothetical protein